MGKVQSRKRKKERNAYHYRRRANTIAGGDAGVPAGSLFETKTNYDKLAKEAFNRDAGIKQKEQEIEAREEQIQSKIRTAGRDEASDFNCPTPKACARIERRYKKNASLRVNPKHYEKPPPSLCEIGDFKEPSTALLKMYKATKITQKELKHWANYGGSQLFYNANQLENRISTVIQYCEQDEESRVCKTLRHITHLLKTQPDDFDRANIFILLAAHGGMCNVQKEVGVRTAYNMMTNNLKTELEKESIANIIGTFSKKWL
mmetsp:Transcript_7824/g.8625  ORF Transcript_7824/g.8625 Transcript_7824/m.8625 type:complete len:261 (-) Transcript_7824:1124-1906(-)